LKYRVKRFMDLVLASLALIILLPFFLLIALAIKLDSKGPVFYLQERLTRDGRIFHMYKFRTMIVNAEQMGTGLFSYADDFRVTRVGNFLRKISLNETPQFINVLKGDMALVGPRPPVKYELGDYNDLDDTYKKRFTVLPGITGLAQVNGRNELTWDQKVFFDNRYIDLFSKYGILVDLKILTLTVIYVLTMKGAYEMQGEKVGGDPDRLSGGDI
jgi:lipopolysaccharide/colanic/teichoic acid biosynthesis glycosyltransferase